MNKPKIKLQATKCPICHNSRNFTLLYPANFKLSDFNIHTFSARRLPDKIHYRLVRCNHDGLVRSNPILNIKQLNSLYQKSQLTYESSIPNLIHSYYQALKPILSSLNHRAKILEIGCGSGFLLHYLNQIGFTNVWGVEPSLAAVKNAPVKIRQRVRTKPFSARLFPANSFDFIFFMQTLDHMPDPNRLLKDCKTLLKPGGYILTFNHDLNSLSAKILKEKSPIIDIEHTHLYDRHTAQLLFTQHNLKIINCYSPTNWVTIRYLLQLLPIHRALKRRLLKLQVPGFDTLSIPLKLGNLCLIAQKSF